MLAPIIVTAIFLSLSLPGFTLCYAQSDATYFPLKAGMTWEYSSTSDKRETRKIIITNLAPQKVNDTTVTPRKWETGGASKYDLVAKDDNGVYLYGEQKSENAEPTILKAKAYYIPHSITEGTSWDITTKLGDDEVKLTLTIEGVNDTVTVPAGTFKDCVKIKHVGNNAPSEKKEAELSLLAYEWYAPKVGWVKSLVTINNKSKNGTIVSEHQNFQLQTFQP